MCSRCIFGRSDRPTPYSIELDGVSYRHDEKTVCWLGSVPLDPVESTASSSGTLFMRQVLLFLFTK
jgi:hypothetical protein